MSKCTVYLVVFAEDLNVEIDTHVLDGMGLLKIPNSKGETLGQVLEETCSLAKAYPVLSTEYFV